MAVWFRIRNWVAVLVLVLAHWWDSNLADCSVMSWVILWALRLDWYLVTTMVMSSVPCFLLDYHLELMKERNFRTEIH